MAEFTSKPLPMHQVPAEVSAAVTLDIKCVWKSIANSQGMNFSWFVVPISQYKEAKRADRKQLSFLHGLQSHRSQLATLARPLLMQLQTVVVQNRIKAVQQSSLISYSHHPSCSVFAMFCRSPILLATPSKFLLMASV